MNSYTYWKAALAGEKAHVYVDDPQLGFYRKGIYKRDERGNKKRTGWDPVAIWINGTTLVLTHPGGDTSDRDRINEVWSYCCANPISEDWYRLVAEEGKAWPDAHDPSKNKPNIVETITSITILDNGQTTVVKEELPEHKLAREIAEARAGVSQYEKVDSDEMAGRALSLKNEITAKAGQLDKIRESLVRPHVDAQKEINGRLNPIITAAKADGSKLLRAIGIHEDFKRAAQRAAQERADREAREHEERIRKAEKTGEPVSIIPPEPVKSNAPPPSTQVAAAVGRKASVKVAKFVTGIDIDKAFAQFRNEPALMGILMTLAQKAVDAGLTVEGATIEERSVVR